MTPDQINAGHDAVVQGIAIVGQGFGLNIESIFWIAACCFAMTLVGFMFGRLFESVSRF